LNQRPQILQRRVRIERAHERRVRLKVVSRQPRQHRLGPAIPEPTQLEIVLQRLEKKLDPAVLRLEIAAGDARQHLRVPDAHHLGFAFGQRRRTLLIEGGDAPDQRLGEAALVDQNARGEEAQQLGIDHREGRLGVNEGVEPSAVERARHPPWSGRAGLADAGHIPIAGGLEVAAHPRAVEDDSVAAMVGGERPDDLGKRLFFVHGRILRVLGYPLQEKPRRPELGLDAASKPEQDAVAAIQAEFCVMVVSLKVNGAVHSVAAEPDTPLLYVLRNDLGLNAAKFGCGLDQCGACTVLVDGAPVRSCVTPIGALGQSEITTLEGLGTVERPHPLQAAFMAEQAAQCGYCIPGMIMLAKALLDRNQQPSEAEVRLGLAGNLCRCGAHNRIVRAILRAAQMGGRI
jgi:nicotinate dehydrogenase subunit A